MRRFLVASSLLLIVLSMAASPLADLAASSAAMACCAKTDYSCAGMSSPDDCCQHMGHTAHAVTPGTLSGVRPLLLTAVAVVPLFGGATTPTTSAPVDAVSPFTRPHDPPHLHPYSLLI